MFCRAHKRTRCVVERGIGQLKRRFHVLHGEVRLKPDKTCKIVYVCAMLHNICKQRNIPLPVDEDEEDVDDPAEVDVDGGNMLQNPDRPAARNGHPFREYVANLHFK